MLGEYQYDKKYLRRVIADRYANQKMLVGMTEYGKRNDLQSMSLVSHRYDLHHYCCAFVAVINMESFHSSYQRNHVVLGYVVTPTYKPFVD